MATDQIYERDFAGLETMQRILHAAGVDGAEHAIDYGGGRGVWSYGFPTATVYDPFPDEWGPARPGVTFTDELDGIEPADAVLLIGVQQLLSHQETVDFLEFARGHLKPGGRVLVTVPAPWMIVEWLLRRVRAFREYPAWVWQLANCLRPGYAGAYCTRRRVFLRLAREHGLRHIATLSREIDDDYRRMAGAVNTGRWYHWLVFEC
jgi:SAM-dependent methyltransferase